MWHCPDSVAYRSFDVFLTIFGMLQCTPEYLRANDVVASAEVERREKAGKLLASHRRYVNTIFLRQRLLLLNVIQNYLWVTVHQPVQNATLSAAQLMMMAWIRALRDVKVPPPCPYAAEWRTSTAVVSRSHLNFCTYANYASTTCQFASLVAACAHGQGTKWRRFAFECILTARDNAAISAYSKHNYDHFTLDAVHRVYKHNNNTILYFYLSCVQLCTQTLCAGIAGLLMATLVGRRKQTITADLDLCNESYFIWCNTGWGRARERGR